MSVFDVLHQMLGFDRYIDGDTVPETDPAKIIAALDNFRDVAVEIKQGLRSQAGKFPVTDLAS